VRSGRGAASLDPVDLRILSEIQRQGRITKLALAERVGLSPTPCWTRLKRLEDIGLVEGYHARISLRALGPVTTVFVEITLDSHRKTDFERFEATVGTVAGVVGCWALGGGVDYLLKVVTRDIESYQHLIDDLLDIDIRISRYCSYIVTSTVRDDPEMPLTLLARGADQAETFSPQRDATRKTRRK
jgi:Lrp/AsnC family transcriptional regulator of ectoine degradation